MTPQELVMSVHLSAQQITEALRRLGDLEHRLGLFERQVRVKSQQLPPCAVRQRPTQRDLAVVDHALSEVVRATGITGLEILRGGRGADLVEARRMVAQRAHDAGLTDGAIGRAMGFDRSTITHLLRNEGGM